MTYSKEDAYLKVTAYCAYRERSVSEVLNKLYGFGLNKDIIEEIIEKLLQENFLNNERFSRTYTRSKLLRNKWGKRKIRQGLKSKGIDEDLIHKTFSEIKEKEYLNILKEIKEKKEQSIKDKDPFLKKRKLANYLLQKGFESDLVWALLKESSP